MNIVIGKDAILREAGIAAEQAQKAAQQASDTESRGAFRRSRIASSRVVGPQRSRVLLPSSLGARTLDRYGGCGEVMNYRYWCCGKCHAGCREDLIHAMGAAFSCEGEIGGKYARVHGPTCGGILRLIDSQEAVGFDMPKRPSLKSIP